MCELYIYCNGKLIIEYNRIVQTISKVNILCSRAASLCICCVCKVIKNIVGNLQFFVIIYFLEFIRLFIIIYYNNVFVRCEVERCNVLPRFDLERQNVILNGR